MKIRNFKEHISGLKKTLIFILVAYLLIVIPIISSLSKESSLIDYAFFIAGITVLVAFIVYWVYAEHNRLITNFQSSGVFTLLEDLEFEIKERNTGWNYEFDIQGNFNQCIIMIDTVSEKGNIWNKYYLTLCGITQAEKSVKNNDDVSDIPTYLYAAKIRLTRNTESRAILEEHLEKFSTQLIGKKTTTNTMQPPAGE